MERVPLNADLELSRIVYGMWRLAEDADTSPAHVRAKIDAGHFADLNVNPTFTTRDLKEVPAPWRKRIPEYIKDYVSLNPFL